MPVLLLATWVLILSIKIMASSFIPRVASRITVVTKNLFKKTKEQRKDDKQFSGKLKILLWTLGDTYDRDAEMPSEKRGEPWGI
ncbi:MAG: hypothetical protein CO002_02350 [Candidatus Portnoybacteria bacterium CG_4_8_14_3_um_filter_44_10]|uniref:Uncharacterized protein n=1 Tax=Candidatus Portnoybacteria bacterium CG_4_8_14_3_um_filter_44_10 TaxID=1974802 RepID=A0A2M7IFS0_9BACT|nr:MAG: hypothetical protein CO002_02350 [Candidatus Portnoybacteria bacterium CG_4_8_14_3_um_filter_44_10]